jgi:glycine reductase
MTKLRVVHYVNQFFGGLGGEEEANAPVQVQEGAVGPGRVLDQALGDGGEIVATIIAGDNFFVEETEKSHPAAIKALKTHKADMVVAGPAFDAGRYGLACAQLCALAQENGVPAVTAMVPDNAGALTYGAGITIVPTGINLTEMAAVMASMSRIAVKLGNGEELGSADEEGYLPRGLRKPVVRSQTGARRAVDMFEARLTGQPFTSEVFIRNYDDVAPPPALQTLAGKTVALVTSGGMVPLDNPDGLNSARAEAFFRYDIEGLSELKTGEWMSVHGGFNTRWLNTHDPNYALPLRAIRELESEGVLGSVYPTYFATTGNQTAVTSAQAMGKEIATELSEHAIDAALLVAT